LDDKEQKSREKQEQRQRQTFERAAEFLRQGDARTAEQFCESGLVDYPADGNLLCLSARALIILGRQDEAEERLLTAMDLNRAFPRPYIIRGDMRLTQGKAVDAVEDFRRAIAMGDKSPDTQMKLGRALMLQGDDQGAGNAVDESMRLDPMRQRIVEAHQLELDGEVEQAEDAYREILRKDPDNVEALRLLAGIASKSKQFRQAEILLERALEIAPDFGKALADLVICQTEQEKLNAAIKNGLRLVKLWPENADSHAILAASYSASGRFDDAINCYNLALRYAPTHSGALSGLGNSLKTIGRQDEAIEIFRRCIDANPYFTQSYFNLANLKLFRFSDSEVSKMQELLELPEIPDESATHLYNSLGLHFESQKKFDLAFEHFERCNQIQRGLEYYDSVETEMLTDHLMDVCDAEFIQGGGADARFEKTPIFIVGLPRSGSTLIEQILASHSHVEGTHELTDLTRVVREMPKLLKIHKRYPESLAQADPAGFSVLGKAYLERTSKYRTGSPFFTDKNPNNFSHIGLIHMMLPDAKIIDARRHPLDSCLGTYKQLFAAGQAFSYDLADLAEYYLQYDRLMGHWESVLPGKVLKVQYEEVVHDLESQVRRILEHCGLPFEEQCLRFHETDRAVVTASSEQVRKPIYSSSVNLWRNYEKHLDILRDDLSPLLIDNVEDRN
jgi:tetratricopeptide (TPR) repeat protein